MKILLIAAGAAVPIGVHAIEHVMTRRRFIFQQCAGDRLGVAAAGAGNAPEDVVERG
jgi:hypothetical protein